MDSLFRHAYEDEVLLPFPNLPAVQGVYFAPVIFIADELLKDPEALEVFLRLHARDLENGLRKAVEERKAQLVGARIKP